VTLPSTASRGILHDDGDTTEARGGDAPQGGAAVIGANCSLQSGEMIELVEEFRLVTQAPLLFQPNAGRPVMEHGLPVYKQHPQEFARTR